MLGIGESRLQGGDLLQQMKKLVMNKTSHLVVDSSWGGAVCMQTDNITQHFFLGYQFH